MVANGEDAPLAFGEDEPKEEANKPDPVLQLVQCFQRAATSEQHQAVAIADDILYISYADVMAKSIHVEEEGGDEGGGDEEVDQAVREFIS